MADINVEQNVVRSPVAFQSKSKTTNAIGKISHASAVTTIIGIIVTIGLTIGAIYAGHYTHILLKAVAATVSATILSVITAAITAKIHLKRYEQEEAAAQIEQTAQKV